MTPENFYNYCLSLIQKNLKTQSSAVDGVGISFGKRTIVRVKREPKFVTRNEIKLLAEEYRKEEQELLDLFTKRKIDVRD